MMRLDAREDVSPSHERRRFNLYGNHRFFLRPGEKNNERGCRAVDRYHGALRQIEAERQLAKREQHSRGERSDPDVPPRDPDHRQEFVNDREKKRDYGQRKECVSRLYQVRRCRNKAPDVCAQAIQSGAYDKGDNEQKSQYQYECE